MSVDKIKQMEAVHNEAIEILKKKNIAYEDAFADYGTAGVIVRISDKIQRVVSVSNSGITLVNTKMLRDILIDLHNYAAMAIMLIDENKINPKNSNQKLNLIMENLDLS